MAVVFPATPAPNQVVTDPVTLATWRWDAPSQRWVPAATGAVFLPLSGGTMTGPVGLVGRTDGTWPTAGQIGEYISGTSFSANVGSGTPWGICVVTLPPGIWECSGGASFAFDTAAEWFGLVQSTTFADMTSGLSAGSVVPGGQQAGVFRLEVNGGRIATSTAVDVYLNENAVFTGSCFMTAFINAIRIA